MKCQSCGEELTTGGCVNFNCPSYPNYHADSRGNPAYDILNNKTGIPELESENHRLSARVAELEGALRKIVNYDLKPHENERFYGADKLKMIAYEWAEMIPNGRPTSFITERGKHYREPFGENWDEVLSRLTPNQRNFVGNEWGSETNAVNLLYAENESLRSLTAELKEDAERLAERFIVVQLDGAGKPFFYCGECNHLTRTTSDDLNTLVHSPDCPVELHRLLMARIEEK